MPQSRTGAQLELTAQEQLLADFIHFTGVAFLADS
jgi:hypothetical protein